MKELIKWMAAGLAGIALATWQHFQAGTPVSLKLVVAFVASALLVRAANWVVANVGPKPL